MIPHSRPDLGPDELAAATRVLASGHLAQGREVAAFEEACAAMVGRAHGVAVSSGTAAIHLALVALGVGADDTVALPSYACAALLHPVLWLGAQPVLCDGGPGFNTPAEACPAGVRVCVVPHLFGAPAGLPPAARVVEDIAQSLGGETGRGGLVAIASFYATKMATTGEGGMLLTDDAGLADLVRDLRDYDNRDCFRVRYAYKLTDLQAAIGRVQLARLPGFIARRREIAAAYNAAFSGTPLLCPEAPGHVYFRYVVRTPQRAALERHLRAAGVEAKRPVYRPLHHDLGGAFPAAESAHAEALSLPIFPAMAPEDVRFVIDSVRNFFD
jgi:perosamine synthetase